MATTPKVRVIHKYPIERDANEYGPFDVWMHGYPYVLSVMVQYSRKAVHGEIVVFAKVDPDATLRNGIIRIVGTGQAPPTIMKASFVGTVRQGPYFWHVFYQYPQEEST